MTTTPPLVTVTYAKPTGQTAGRLLFQENGNWPDNMSTISWATGSAASTLGLAQSNVGTQNTGALISPVGEVQGPMGLAGMIQQDLSFFSQYAYFMTDFDPDLGASPTPLKDSVCAWSTELNYSQYRYASGFNATAPAVVSFPPPVCGPPATASLTPHTGVWLDGGVGAGDLTDQVVVYPDCTPGTTFQCTKILRTDTTVNYIWKTCTTPSCLINGQVAGYGWVPLPLPANVSGTTALNMVLSVNAFGQYPPGSEGAAACAWTTDQAQSVSGGGSTSNIFAIMNGTIAPGGGNTFGAVYVTTNKGASWVDTQEPVLIKSSGGNDEGVRDNSPIVWCDPNSSGQVAFVGQYGGALLKTANGGGTWASVGGGCRRRQATLRKSSETRLLRSLLG